MAKGGKQPGAGRPPGPDKAKRMLAEILETMNCDPLRILADIAKGERVKCTTYLDKDRGEHMEEAIIPTLDQRKDACKELLSYVHPKKKAVEHSGPNGDPIKKDVTHHVKFHGADRPA